MSYSRFTNRSLIAGLFLFAGSTVALAPTARADVTPSGAMLRFPAISKDRVAFVYANDIWTAPREGGLATPLSTPDGIEMLPRFSPDGTQVVFSANYDGVQSLYTIDLGATRVGDGTPRRLTHFPATPMPVGWNSQNQIMFYSGPILGDGFGRMQKLYHVGPEGGMPQLYPVPYGTFASVSPDGSTLAYIPHTTDFRTWKRYRGGMATDIWLFNLKDNSAKLATDWEGTDTMPMFNPAGDGKTLYYTSDQGPEHRLNIWSYDLTSGTRKQVTNFTDNDVRFPSIGPGPEGKGEIIFQLGSDLTVLDLGTGKTRVINVTIPGDRPTLRPRAFDAARNLTEASLSPSGKRVAVVARGDVWTAPAKDGVIRNLTRTEAINEREVEWSPDSRWFAYISDESGEYELWVRPSDARPPAKKEDDKKDEGKKDEGKKDEAKPEQPKGDDAAKDAPAEPAKDAEKSDEPVKQDAKKDDAAKDESKAPNWTGPHRLTALGAGQRSGIHWSPDSKHIVFSDQAGRLYLLELATEKLVEIDRDPWAGGGTTVSFSHDSAWIAYDRADEASGNEVIWLYNIRTGEKHQVTHPMFSSSSPAFDRKGDFLYFTSSRVVSGPDYGQLPGDTTWIYTNVQALHMLPLRKDVKSPLLATSDEETLKDEKKAEPAKEPAKKDAPKTGEAAAADDGVSGSWSGNAKGPEGSPLPPGGLSLTMNLKLAADGTVTGSINSPMGNIPVTSGRFDKATGELSLSITTPQGAGMITGKISGNSFEGTWNMGPMSGSFTATRAAGGAEAAADTKSADKKDDAKKSEPKEIKIDLGETPGALEHRAIRLPLAPGSFWGLATTHDDKLIFVRGGPESSAGIRIFDPKDDKREEKAVTAGTGFQLSADGKKILVRRGPSLAVMDAAAGGGNSTNVPTAGMSVNVNPRAEWRQILRDVYRYQRDFFYEPTLHGVDWDKVHAHYEKMLEDAVSREDVTWIIAEMISELNIGHAYVSPPPPGPDAPAQIGVGLLGADFALEKTDQGEAYKITRIYNGGPWDTDARSPLSQAGIDVKEGEFLLAVNGVPVDTRADVWAAFQGMADRTVTLTIGKTPALSGPAAQTREVTLRTLSSDATLRYRSWIERNRAYVYEKSKGRIGYIYVPDTGQGGQNDLVRQFFGQRHMDALLIDERWNGGGQIPTRFVELLNRPNINYWARKDGRDWPWPPDGHYGPKAMLANGLSGSGGDAFPGYFQRMGLGKVIGRRTWGGLVGIQGNRPLIDGGGVTVPSFGFYERDPQNPTQGKWAIEGHGTDPDIDVLDDPSKMVNGNGDPQLDAGIEHLLKELETKAYVAPKRPPSPRRDGMGIPPNER